MDARALHLLLNHLAPVGAVFACMLAVYIWRARRPDLRPLLYFFGLIICLSALVGKITGERALERQPLDQQTVYATALQTHDDWGHYSFFAAAPLALVFFLLWRREARLAAPLPHWVDPLMVLLWLAMLGLLGYTAHTGGLIHHPYVGW